VLVLLADGAAALVLLADGAAALVLLAVCANARCENCIPTMVKDVRNIAEIATTVAKAMTLDIIVDFLDIMYVLQAHYII
jgi:hypothetical protein